jgi:hypothetical protein
MQLRCRNVLEVAAAWLALPRLLTRMIAALEAGLVGQVLGLKRAGLLVEIIDFSPALYLKF